MSNLKFIPINLQLFANPDESNPLSNFFDFVNEEEDTEEIVEEIEEIEASDEDDLEEIEDEEESEQPNLLPVKKVVKKVDSEEPKKQLSKQEYALVAEKRKNKDILKLVESLANEVKELKESENERSTTNKRAKLISEYIEDGYDENSATKLADKDLKIDNVSSEIGNLKKMMDELINGKQSTFDVKTQTEQSVLYKQGKGQKAKTDLAANPERSESIQMTKDDLRVFNMLKKISPNLTAKEFKANKY